MTRDREPDDESIGRAAEVAGRHLAGRIALFAAIALHLMVGALLPLTPETAPGWVLPLAILGWVVGALTIWSWHRVRAIATLFIPFGMLGLWYGTLLIGEVLLGWSD